MIIDKTIMQICSFTIDFYIKTRLYLLRLYTNNINRKTQKKKTFNKVTFICYF